jgi:hypothetical protein
VTYASEILVLKETVIQKLLVFESNILRRIFGSTKENQIWRVKTNEELDKLIKDKSIINYIKAQRLSWFGHVQRMSDIRTVKKTQVQMGGYHQTGHLPIEDQKLDSLRP